MPVNSEALAPHIIGSLEGRTRVAAPDLYARCVGSRAVVDEHRAIACLLPIQHRRQVLDVGRDHAYGILREVRTGRHHDGHGLADITHLVRGQRQLQKMLESGHRGNARPDRLQHRFEFRMREYADNPGHGRRRSDVDAQNSSMRPRASKHRGVQHAIQMHIVDIAAAAGEEPRILASWERLTHVHGHGAHPDMAHPGGRRAAGSHRRCR